MLRPLRAFSAVRHLHQLHLGLLVVGAFSLVSLAVLAAPLVTPLSVVPVAQASALTAHHTQRAQRTFTSAHAQHISTADQPARQAQVTVARASSDVPGMISQVFGPYAGQALNIARCESGYNPSATNPRSGAAGVFQFIPSTWRGTSYAGYSPYNAWANVNAAHEVFVRDGYSWSEWVC
jgi:hypothetical protein